MFTPIDHNDIFFNMKIHTDTSICFPEKGVYFGELDKVSTQYYLLFAIKKSFHELYYELNDSVTIFIRNIRKKLKYNDLFSFCLK